MSYTTAVGYLYGLQKHGIKLGLENMRELMARLGLSVLPYHVVHIGGTNGKGSTAAMTASMLQAGGYRTGLYTSPHLVDFRERIRVNGDMILEAGVEELTERVRVVLTPSLSPTFFEFTTAMALQHFANTSVDVAVLEVGMGGRFDATNIAEPLVSAVTTVALDHEAYLGHTVRAIAREKAGIIKRGVPVVAGRLGSEAGDVMAEVAERHAAPLLRLNVDFRVSGDSTTYFLYEGLEQRYEALFCPLAGAHQLDNAACALAILETAGRRGLRVSEKDVRDGLRSVTWEGRLEVVGHQPTVVLDGAHNPAAAAALAVALSEWKRQHPEARIWLVVSMMSDKNHRGFFECLRPVADEIILTQAEIARAASVDALHAEIADWLLPVHRVPLPADALALAKRLASPSDLICMTGSLMLAGDVKALLLGCGLSPLRG